MRDLLLVGTGGFFGAIARFALAAQVAKRLGTRFPHGTLVVNLTGCLLAGLLAALLLRPAWVGTGRPLLAVGFLGAYTTFATFELETLKLLQDGQQARAAAYVALSLGLGLAAVWLGWVAGRALWR